MERRLGMLNIQFPINVLDTLWQFATTWIADLSAIGLLVNGATPQV
jgi:hypothetical protein